MSKKIPGITKKILEGSGKTRWVVSYRDVTQRQRTKTFTKKDQAERFKAERDQERRANAGRDVVDRREWQLSKFYDQLCRDSSHWKPSSRQRNEGLWNVHIGPAFGHRPVAQIRLHEINDWLAGIDRSESTKRLARILLAQVFDVAVSMEAIPGNPAAAARKPKAGRPNMLFLTKPQVARLQEAIDPRFKFLVTFAVWTGMRQGELFALERGDLTNGIVRVSKTVRWIGTEAVVTPPKSNKERSIAFTGIAEHMRRHLATHDHELVWPSQAGTHLRSTNFRRNVWVPAVAAAELNPKLRFHDLRHTCVSLRSLAGESPQQIQAVMGHASITTTIGIYNHVYPEAVVKADEQLGALLSDLL